jgi:hypothetical protein
MEESKLGARSALDADADIAVITSMNARSRQCLR